MRLLRAAALLTAALLLLTSCATPEAAPTGEPPADAPRHIPPGLDPNTEPDPGQAPDAGERGAAQGEADTEPFAAPEGAPQGEADTEPLAAPEGVPPARLRVPAIDVDEELIDLGFQPDGAMEVPADWDRAGWFTGGGKPGGAGPTVIAGHVDSSTGPAVFFRLTELAVGDRIEVTDTDGTVHDYQVYEVADLPKDAFPTARVFGALATDELRLVTCTGEFDPVLARHADNRVVFAEPVGG